MLLRWCQFGVVGPIYSASGMHSRSETASVASAASHAFSMLPTESRGAGCAGVQNKDDTTVGTCDPALSQLFAMLRIELRAQLIIFACCLRPI